MSYPDYSFGSFMIDLYLYSTLFIDLPDIEDLRQPVIVQRRIFVFISILHPCRNTFQISIDRPVFPRFVVLCKIPGQPFQKDQKSLSVFYLFYYLIDIHNLSFPLTGIPTPFVSASSPAISNTDKAVGKYTRRQKNLL